MDAFFASVEQRDFPEYRGKPLAVGGKGRRGVISAASYEARKFGVRSAMPGHIALQKCPELIFAKHRFDVYEQVSEQIRDIFFDYTDLVEPLSLDEAFLDVTENKLNIPSASFIAKDIKRRIKIRTGLNASAGVSFNKFLAKIASDYDKPDGFFLIAPEMAEKFVEDLEIEKFFGIGKVTAEKLHKHGIFKGADIKKLSLQELIPIFGSRAEYFFNIARAVDNRPVVASRIRKSIGAERTFENDIQNINEINSKLEKTIEVLFERCSEIETYGKTLTLKIKFSDFKTISRSKTDFQYLDSFEKIRKLALVLIDEVDFTVKSIRLLGLSVSNLSNSENSAFRQLSFNFNNI